MSYEPLFYEQIKESKQVTVSDVEHYECEKHRFTKATDISVTPIMSVGDTVMYLVNLDSGGWELLSANRYAPIVLAHADKGTMTVDKLFDCPAQEFYFTALGEFFSSISSDKEISGQDASNNWLAANGNTRDDEIWLKLYSEYIYEDVELQEHLLETQWYQSNKWNIRAPYKDSTLTTHCSTGCTMVAAAQVLYYMHQNYNKPATSYGVSYCSAFVPSGGDDKYIQLTNSNISFVGVTNTSSTWDLMPLRIESGHTDTEYGCVSTLMVRLGKLLGAKYRRTGAFAGLTNLPSVFSSEYSISSTLTSDFSKSRIRNQIYVNKKPVIMSIYKQNADSLYDGHTIVLDGYKKVKSTKVTYYANLDRTKFKTVYDTPTYSEHVGINWGWSSAFNHENTAGAMSWYYLSDSFFGNEYSYNYADKTVYNFH